MGLSQFGSLLSLEGLAVSNADGRALPRLVQSWNWEENELRLRVRLRPDVVFHDETPLTSSIVATILRAAVASPDARQSYSSLSDITDVRAEGDLDVIIDLSQRSGFLIEDLTMPLTIGRGVGTGPYRIVERSDSEMLFERFDDYYQGLPAIHRIRVQVFDTLRSAWTSLLRDDVDMVTDVPAEAVEFIQTDDVNVITYERWFQFMVLFDLSDSQFTSPLVRRALNVAIDRELLITRALKGYAEPSTGPVWPQHWAYDDSVPRYEFDPRLAIALLEQAGLRVGSAPASDLGPPTARLRLTCLIPQNFSLLQRIGLEVQRQLYDVGVDMQFEVVPLEQYLTRLQAGQFQSALVDMISGPSFGRLYIFWRSAKTFKGLNRFGYENAEAEKLFQLLRTSSTNEAAVRSATTQLQRVFFDDPPAVFLAWNERTRAVRSEYRVFRETGRDPMPTLWRWTTSVDNSTSSR